MNDWACAAADWPNSIRPTPTVVILLLCRGLARVIP